MRRETAILMIPVLAAGIAMVQGRRRTVPSLRITDANGEPQFVRTSQILAILSSHGSLVKSHGRHAPLSTLWIVGQDTDLDAQQYLDQFRPFIGNFVEFHTEDGPAFVNPARVNTIQASGLLTGSTPETLQPTTQIIFEGGRKLIVSEAPEYAARSLGRAA